MNDQHRENIGIAFSQLAQHAVALRRLVLQTMQVIDTGEQGELQDATIHGLEYMGLIADRWAKEYGALQSLGGVDEWSMPPIFNFNVDQ